MILLHHHLHHHLLNHHRRIACKGEYNNLHPIPKRWRFPVWVLCFRFVREWSRESTHPAPSNVQTFRCLSRISVKHIRPLRTLQVWSDIGREVLRELIAKSRIQKALTSLSKSAFISYMPRAAVSHNWNSSAKTPFSVFTLFQNLQFAYPFKHWMRRLKINFQ